MKVSGCGLLTTIEWPSFQSGIMSSLCFLQGDASPRVPATPREAPASSSSSSSSPAPVAKKQKPQPAPAATKTAPSVGSKSKGRKAQDTSLKVAKEEINKEQIEGDEGMYAHTPHPHPTPSPHTHTTPTPPPPTYTTPTPPPPLTQESGRHSTHDNSCVPCARNGNRRLTRLAAPLTLSQPGQRRLRPPLENRLMRPSPQHLSLQRRLQLPLETMLTRPSPQHLLLQRNPAMAKVAAEPRGRSSEVKDKEPMRRAQNQPTLVLVKTVHKVQVC